MAIGTSAQNTRTNESQKIDQMALEIREGEKWNRDTAVRAVANMALRFNISPRDAGRLMQRIIDNENGEREIRNLQSRRNAPGSKIPSKRNIAGRISYPLIREGQEMYGPVYLRAESERMFGPIGQEFFIQRY